MIFATATKWAEATIPSGETVLPLLIRLYDRLDGRCRDACIAAVESWVVRRKLARCNTGGDKQALGKLSREIREAPDDAVLRLLISDLQERGWPTNEQLRCEVVRRNMRPHKRLAHTVLKAIEHRVRSERSLDPPASMEIEQEIEHLMPIGWDKRRSDWPFPGETNQGDRNNAIWTLGNLTLTTWELNRELSNHSWQDKRTLLRKHDEANPDERFLETHVLRHCVSKSEWNEESIRCRSRELAGYICAIWPDAEHF